jgi:arylsulfatase
MFQILKISWFKCSKDSIIGYGRTCVLLGFILFLLPGCQKTTFMHVERELPNIILIITDDQGYGDLGYHGNPIIQTPVIDSLAKHSMRLKNFYVSPVCAPTRSSLMTGRYSLRTGVFDTYNGGAIMSDTEITIAEYLEQAGYRTGIFGKWHLGDVYPYRPHDQGFEVSYVHAGGGIGQPGDYYENFVKGDSSYFNPVLEYNGVKMQTKGYCSDVFTDLAVSFIKESKNAPFFAYVSYNAPHTPLQVPDEYLNMYEHMEIKTDLYPYGGGPEDMNDRDIEAARRVYAMVTNIDDNFKRIWTAVEEEGISDNTLIIFITDNGPQQRRFNGNLRSRKGSVYEGGIRVPSFWHWPGKFDMGESDYVSAHIDILPTILDVCGISLNSDHPVDGISLLPILKGESPPKYQRQMVHYWHRGYFEPYHNIAFRAGNLKLVAQGDYQMSDSLFELYDISKDPFEMEDISQKAPEVVDSLKSAFDAWHDEVMKSENLDIRRIFVGTSHQNPVILGRNDNKGASAKQWMSETGLGYWDVMVAESGNYDVSVRFFNPIGIPGRTYVRFGKTQRSFMIREDTGSLVVFRNLPLEAGPCMVEAWHEYGGRIYAPINVEVFKHSE